MTTQPDTTIPAPRAWVLHASHLDTDDQIRVFATREAGIRAMAAIADELLHDADVALAESAGEGDSLYWEVAEDSEEGCSSSWTLVGYPLED